MHETISPGDMQEEKTRALLEQTGISAYATMAAALAGFGVLSWYHFSPWLLAWLIGLISVSLFRLRLHQRYMQWNRDTCPLQELAAQHKRALIVSGCLWGLLAAFPGSVLPLELHPLPLLGIAIVAVAALSSYAVCMDQYRTFLGSLSVSVCLTLVITTGAEATPNVIVFAILALMLNAIGRGFAGVLERSFRGQREAQEVRSELRQASRDLRRQQELFGQEEEIARHVFNQLTLSSDDNLPGVHTWNQAMGKLSGDLIQVARAPGGDIYIFLGDFTGHGLPAALGAVPASSVFRTMVGKGLEVEVIAEELNNKLNTLLPTGYFCCAAILNFSADRTRLSVWNGGLPPILIRRQENGATLQLQGDNLPLGVVEAESYSGSCSHWNLKEGDRILVYSDGLTEAENAHGEMWGRTRLERFFTRFNDSGPMLDQLKAEILGFTRQAAASDDISVIEVQAGEACSELEVA